MGRLQPARRVPQTVQGRGDRLIGSEQGVGAARPGLRGSGEQPVGRLFVAPSGGEGCKGPLRKTFSSKGPFAAPLPPSPVDSPGFCGREARPRASCRCLAPKVMHLNAEIHAQKIGPWVSSNDTLKRQKKRYTTISTVRLVSFFETVYASRNSQ
jgi:hypothetical protein